MEKIILPLKIIIGKINSQLGGGGGAKDMPLDEC